MSEEHLDYGKYHTFSGGITAIILPFPSLRFQKLLKLSKKRFPLPKPPKKKIKVVDGYETIDNLKDKKYLAEKEEIERKQSEWYSDKTLRICLRDCVELDLTQYEDIITVLEEDNEEAYPENPLNRKVEFLLDYVIRSAGDFQALIKIATKLMQVSEEEISEQLDSFPNNIQKNSTNKTKTSSIKKKQRLDIQSKS